MVSSLGELGFNQYLLIGITTPWAKLIGIMKQFYSVVLSKLWLNIFFYLLWDNLVTAKWSVKSVRFKVFCYTILNRFWRKLICKNAGSICTIMMSYLKSFWLEKSHADAWHTTSLSEGFSIMDSAQNSVGISINPSEVKNSSETWNIFSASYP